MGDTSEWLKAKNQTTEQADIVANLDSFQACRVGFVMGGQHAVDFIERLVRDHGASAESAISLVRVYWQQHVTQWAQASTVVGQEVVPLIPVDVDKLISADSDEVEDD
jgi:hypothetical protein